jgi:dienelactone hydrolase
MAVFGAYDMAGNVKEWAANAVGPKRYALGGGWDEFSYVFVVNDARDPSDRFGNLGFRCVKRVAEPPPASFAAVVSAELPVREQEAVGETEYQLLSRLHKNYDSSKPLESKVDQSDDTSPFWTRLDVSFEPVYPGSRVVGHLFLPKDVQPPYQAIIMFGGSGVMERTRLEETEFPFEFIVRSGRAVLIPAYWGTLERGPSKLGLPRNEEVERSLRWYWDLVRSVDYLDTREDIDIERLGFYGVSWGASHAPRFLAMDTRFKAAAFMSGGLLRVQPPEVDSWNFAPRYTVPTIMINGRHDVITALETNARLLFNALGTADKDKKLVDVDGGHANPVIRPELLGQIIDWFDDRLGPVESRQASGR